MLSQHAANLCQSSRRRPDICLPAVLTFLELVQLEVISGMAVAGQKVDLSFDFVVVVETCARPATSHLSSDEVQTRHVSGACTEICLESEYN